MSVTKHKFQGVYLKRKGKRSVYLTKNITPGKTVYGEEIHREKGAEYREWDPTRSKISAALHKKVSQLGIYPGNIVLYLGASTGTTASHISDLVGKDGFVFALDFAPRTTKELVFLCERRSNMTPLLDNALHPENYAHLICGVDVVIQDIAQRDQPEIFIRNCDAFLKKNGFGILSVKARSIDVTKRPKEIFNKVRTFIEKHITIVDYRELDPFEKDHCIFICKKK